MGGRAHGSAAVLGNPIPPLLSIRLFHMAIAAAGTRHTRLALAVIPAFTVGAFAIRILAASVFNHHIHLPRPAPAGAIAAGGSPV